MTTPWQAAAARIPFPIPPGTPLAGYAARTGTATGTLDELQITALVLDHAGRCLILVAADIVAVDPSLASAVASAAGVDPDRLILAASHTHSGPAGIVHRLHPAHGDEPIDAVLRDRFVAACGTTVRTAAANLAPATLHLGRANAPGIAANRNTPGGPSTDRVTTLTVHTTNGETPAVLVHFACHPTILGAESLAVSADLPGGLRRALAPHLSGANPVVLVANGAAGDISTRSTRRSQEYPEVARLGGLLADGATRAMATPTTLSGPIRRLSRTVPLPRKRDPGPDAIAVASSLRAAAERILASDVPEPAKRRALTRAQGSELAASLAGATGIPEAATLSAWSLGGLAIVTVPGELFASLGQEIELGSPFATTLVIGYANGHVGYLVDADAERAQTYEALASPYPAAASDAIVQNAIQMLHDLHAVAAG